MKFYVSLLVILVSFLGCRSSYSVSEIGLKKDWTFKQTDSLHWKSATVPGTVHTDLLNLHEIEDPFYRLNEHNLQWIDKTNWEYQTSFTSSKKDLSKQNIELEFSGLDTYSKIFLNDSLILETDNMFRNYKKNIKPFIKLGVNTLRIIFESPIQKGIEKYDTLGYKIPVSENDLAEIGKVEDNKQVSIFTRKAGYHFGWDWGPRLVTSGIWRPIILRYWNNLKIEDLYIKQISLSNKAILTANIEVNAFKANKNSRIELFVNDTLIKITKRPLTQGKNELSIPFEIINPQLWWPNGMGKQVLYNVQVKIKSADCIDTISKKIGLRTIELVTESDSIGNAFYFKVNGYPTFMKGANYIPQDVFLPRVNNSQYQHILSSAKEANMNMLRVWGGGIYENDEFYDLCDEMGILVWQDFMFACAMFPGDASFLENVKQEAIDNVKRLRNHPSIALWCGNNEILSAWENWGWKDQVFNEQSKLVADNIWNAYDNIFHKILPEVVNKFDNTRGYWPSSPGSAFGIKESMGKGDAHYWSVWWGKEPFSKYNTSIPRFMSEYGFQSFPELKTVETYTLPEDYSINSDVMKSHQRSEIGNETIEEYMVQYYKPPKDFSNYLYVSQLLQAYGIQTGMEAHRRNRQRCMGSLYWQINDCWPVASWSSIDYLGKWKALHYYAKKSFQNTLISFEDTLNTLHVFIVSDSLIDIESKLEISVINFEGEALKHWEKPVTVSANNSKNYFKILKSDISKFDASKVFIQANLYSNDSLTANKILYLKPFKNLDLTNPELTYTVSENEDEFLITIKTQKLAIGVFLSSLLINNFSDNYFDMTPQSEKTVRIKKDNSVTLNSFKNSLIIISLKDSFVE